MQEFDYVIVGAGSAGCVLANRLTERPDATVLALEAGGQDNSVFMKAPLAWRQIWRGPKYNWNYATEPEAYCDGRRISLPRGKVLGGSSSINGMLYVRGNPRDYDLWRQAGCEGWSYADVLPYFKRAEGSWRGEGDYHGGSGPLGVSPTDVTDLNFDLIRDTARAAGIPFTDDFSGAQPEGFGIVDLTIKDGAARERLAGLSQARDEARQPEGRDRRAVQENPDRERPRGRDRLFAGRRREDRARPARGHPQRRLLQLAATAAALGHRPGRGIAQGRHRARARPARRRKEPLRARRVSCAICDEAADHLPQPPARRPGRALGAAMGPVPQAAISRPRR